MAEMVSLDSLLVDPRFSPRAVPVDEDYLDRLTEVLAEGGPSTGSGLPPLKLARVGDRTAPWCACLRPHVKRQRAEFEAETERIPWAQRPLMPELVLYDGLTTFWAYVRAGKKKAPAATDPVPVASPAEVTALAVMANAKHGRKLEDADLRVTVARLWLGRPVREKNESWVPERGGLELDEIAQRFGMSVSWAGDMQVYIEVNQQTGIDLGLTRSRVLGRLPKDRRRPFCWVGENLVLRPLLDEELRPVHGEAPRPVTKLSRAQLERHVARELAAVEVGGPTHAPPPAAGDGTGTLPLEPDRYYDGVLPEFDDLRDRTLALFEAAPRMSREQLAEALSAFRPAYLDTQRTWDRLTAEARRFGLET